MATTAKKRKLDLEKLVLKHGSHSPDGVFSGGQTPRSDQSSAPEIRARIAGAAHCSVIEVPMIHFIDGPANGVYLSLQRLVMFLRVVRSADGKWDALDQLDDVPAPDEAICVYKHQKTDGSAFVDGRDPKTGKRWGRVEHIATYRFHDVQPTDAEMRDNAAWTAWCQAQPEAAKFKEKTG